MYCSGCNRIRLRLVADQVLAERRGSGEQLSGARDAWRQRAGEGQAQTGDTLRCTRPPPPLSRESPLRTLPLAPPHPTRPPPLRKRLASPVPVPAKPRKAFARSSAPATSVARLQTKARTASWEIGTSPPEIGAWPQASTIRAASQAASHYAMPCVMHHVHVPCTIYHVMHYASQAVSPQASPPVSPPAWPGQAVPTKEASR